MKAVHRRALISIAVFVSVAGAAFFAPRASAQENEWRIVHADYGWKAQRNDVTDLVRDLISRGGVNGRVSVNNQTMGGDPAVGKDKSLRIIARNRSNQQREFDYNEGAFVDAAAFVVTPDDDWDARGGDSGRDSDRDADRGASYAGRDRDDWDSLIILRGFYGVQGRMANITPLLRTMVRRGTLTLNVNNAALGGDPAIGAEKVLIVIYRYQGQEQATAIREGNTLSIP